MIELSVVDSGNNLTQLVPLSRCLASFLQVEIVKNDSVKFILPIAVACLLAKLRVAARAKEEAAAKGDVYICICCLFLAPSIQALPHFHKDMMQGPSAFGNFIQTESVFIFSAK